MKLTAYDREEKEWVEVNQYNWDDYGMGSDSISYNSSYHNEVENRFVLYWVPEEGDNVDEISNGLPELQFIYTRTY